MGEPVADDPVLADARLAVASRDDHSGICGSWPVGLLRRALLASGERLHAAGRLDDPTHALEQTSRPSDPASEPDPLEQPIATPGPGDRLHTATTVVIEEGAFRTRLRRPRDLVGALAAVVGLPVVVPASAGLVVLGCSLMTSSSWPPSRSRG